VVDNVGSQGDAFSLDASRVVLTNSIVWGHDAWLHSVAGGDVVAGYCDIEGGHPGTGVIDSDPLLTDGMHIASNSPCIGSGSALAVPGQDLDGDDRPISAMDIGADEYADSDDDELPDWWELAYFGNLSEISGDDFDGDLVSNLNEYRSNTDPTNSLEFPNFSISGQIFSDRPQSGIIRLVAVADVNAWTGVVVDVSSPGAFTATNLPAFSTYWLKAYWDGNGDGAKGATEPWGAYLNGSIYLVTNASNVDISFVLDEDKDGMPDWWEPLYGLSSNFYGDAIEDGDADGIPNYFEYRHFTDPASGVGSNVPLPHIVVTNGVGLSIQGAIDAAAPYDIIQVLQGVYTGAGNRDITFSGKTVLLASDAGPSATILDAGGANRHFTLRNETGRTVIKGFAARLGVAVDGGAVYATNSSLGFSTCLFESNSVSGRGGAVYIDKGMMSFDRCRFLGNEAAGDGGGLWVTSALVWVQHCAVSRNEAAAGGGASFHSATGRLLNSTFSTNIATAGSALSLDTSILSMTNCIVWGHASPRIELVNGASYSRSYSDIEGAGTGGTGNLDEDPELRRDGFHLTAGSPCRGAGSLEASGPRDIDDEATPSTNVDVGADEYIDTDSDGMPDWWEVANGLDAGADDAAIDHDGDAVASGDEYVSDIDPQRADSDGDGINDADDDNPGSALDADGDGMPDDWESSFDILAEAETDDHDGDGILNIDEYRAGTNPTVSNAVDGDNATELKVFTPIE
jgi:hypothetical protein